MGLIQVYTLTARCRPGTVDDCRSPAVSPSLTCLDGTDGSGAVPSVLARIGTAHRPRPSDGTVDIAVLSPVLVRASMLPHCSYFRAPHSHQRIVYSIPCLLMFPRFPVRQDSYRCCTHLSKPLSKLSILTAQPITYSYDLHLLKLDLGGYYSH